jgi:hypothetical protein
MSSHKKRRKFPSKDTPWLGPFQGLETTDHFRVLKLSFPSIYSIFFFNRNEYQK